MAWWRRTRKAETGAAPSPPPAARSETDLECFARWWRYWAAVRVQQEGAHAEQVRQEEAQRVERAARERDRIMAIMARNGGSWFPGDELDLPREAPPGLSLEAGGAGPWGRLVPFEAWAAQNPGDYVDHSR